MSKKDEFSSTESLFKDRTLFINDSIDKELANDMVARLIYLNNKNPNKDIEIIISSGGGSVSAGLSIIDIMDLVECDIKTTVLGEALSMAFIIAMCGTKGKRAATKYSELMAHDISGGVIGKLGDMSTEIEQAKHISNLLKGIVEDRSNLDRDAVEELFSKNSYYTAKDALENGFIDKII